MKRQAGTRPTTMRSQNETSAGSRASPNPARNAACTAGDVVAKRKGRPAVCNRATLDTLRRQVEAEPDLTVAEHRARLYRLPKVLSEIKRFPPRINAFG
jgi:hypothetical protein